MKRLMLVVLGLVVGCGGEEGGSGVLPGTSSEGAAGGGGHAAGSAGAPSGGGGGGGGGGGSAQAMCVPKAGAYHWKSVPATGQVSNCPGKSASLEGTLTFELVGGVLHAASPAGWMCKTSAIGCHAKVTCTGSGSELGHGLGYDLVFTADGGVAGTEIEDRYVPTTCENHWTLSGSL